MAIDILMPALSPTMTEGTLARWIKAEGEAVRSGEVIAEIETDKATLEFEAAQDGILGRILVPGGTGGVKVDQPIALLMGLGEEVAPAAPPSLAPRGTGRAGKGEGAGATASRLFASPLARRIARDRGIDLASVAGSGPRGRIVKADVEAARPPAPPSVPAPPVPRSFEPAYEEVPNSSMRKTIARRLTEAKATIPHFYLTVDCELDALLGVRAELNGRSDAYRLSLNDFVVRAVALALRKVPAANAAWGEAAIRRYTDIDVSVAVATPGGLVTPVLRHADRKGLAELSNEMKDLAAKARDGKLRPEEYQGGGFTVSNLGMHGVRQFAAIINPPQGCILAVGAGEHRPVVRDGALAVATVMTCTLSVDHRVVDGAAGAAFLAAFKRLVEDPLTMLL